jgi:3-hydroxyisobutyrate dehydrogenase-like beta-hydroxyacid dehydrogenase
MSKASIGFLGTGIMGFQMARRLAEAGYPVKAWNRSRAKAERLEPFGITIADRPTDAVAGCSVVISMLSNGPTTDEVLFGPDDTRRIPIEIMDRGAVLVVMSSIPVETARAEAGRAAAHGIAYVDAPVSGGEVGATEGTLSIMAGGDAQVIGGITELLGVMGRVTHVGPAGSGSLAKLANQIIVANTIAAVAEALLLATVGGADPAAVREALRGGFADSRILDLHGRRMIEGNWQPGGPAKHQLKDLRSAADLAAELKLDLPVSSLVQELFEDMLRQGGGELDHGALFLEIARRNGLGALSADAPGALGLSPTAGRRE